MSIAAAAIAVGMATAGTFAYAEKYDQGDKEDMLAMDQVKVSLVQAIQTAEQQTQGKAMSAELKSRDNAVIYKIEVINGTHTTDVKVDAVSGAIIASAQGGSGDQDGAD